MTNESMDIEGVKSKFGVYPERIVDYLTLVGDAVDNVPGVEKVGPKTAAKWIEEFGSLEGVIAAAENMKGKVGEHLRAALDWLPQGRRLITIKQDCDLQTKVLGWPDLSSFSVNDADLKEILSFYTRYGFRTWKRELEEKLQKVAAPALTPIPTPTPQANLFDDPDVHSSVAVNSVKESEGEGRGLYETISTPEALQAWVEKLRASPLSALDTETDALDPMRAKIIGVSFSVKVDEAAYVPLGHVDAGGAAPQMLPQIPLDVALAMLRPWLEDAKALKVGQNIKFDLHVFANHGIEVKGYTHDTMLQSYVLEAHKPHSLESLALRHLERRGLSYEDVCGKGAQQIPFAQVPIGRATLYSGEDSDQTLDVHQKLWPQLQMQDNEKLRWVYEHLEVPIAHALQRIERNGVLIDVQALSHQTQALTQRMEMLQTEAHALAGRPFNLGSPKQIGEILFTEMGIKPVKKTAGGAASTDEDVLEILAADHPLPAKILEYRGLSKLKNTYTEKLPAMVNPVTGRVHTNYAQAVAVTGRLSSNEPNLQNIPIRTAEGRRIRCAFVAAPGHVMASADYSQIELRIMAHISEDEVLLKAFEQGLDIHRATAAEVFNIAPEQATSEQRRYAKVINFGLIYGMGAFGLARSLGIEQKAAKDYIDRYFTRFAGVKRYMEETRANAKEAGYVETVFGRRLWLPEINSPNGPRQKGAERQAINAPMQGTAADLIKLAMLAVQSEIDAQQLKVKIVMQVHDELVFEVPKADTDWVRTQVPRIMAGVADLKVPLIAEVGIGKNWEEAH
jgi:DNA polymerase-1